VGDVGALVNNAAGVFESVGEIDLTKNGCDPTEQTCGPPRVVFTGGGGTGAAGNAVVNRLGEVVGVVMKKPGCGYVEPPVVSFIDDCSIGQYAKGRAIIGKVGDCIGIIRVVIDDPGEKYLNRRRKIKRGKLDDPFIPNDNLGEDVGIGTEPDGKTYVGIITDVDIRKPGYGYDKDTKIRIGNCEAEAIIGPGGIIQGVKVLGSCYNNVLPPITINSNNGVAAELVPVLRFIPVSGNAVGISTIVTDKVIKVIDCV